MKKSSPPGSGGRSNDERACFRPLLRRSRLGSPSALGVAAEWVFSHAGATMRLRGGGANEDVVTVIVAIEAHLQQNARSPAIPSGIAGLDSFRRRWREELPPARERVVNVRAERFPAVFDCAWIVEQILRDARDVARVVRVRLPAFRHPIDRGLREV